MQVTEVASDGLKRAYEVTVPQGEVAAARDKRLTQLARDLRLPGFRPGKVPMAVVAKRYGASVMGEVLEERVQDATRQIVTDRGLKPAQQPKIELKDFGDDKDLAFRVDLEVMPEVPLPDFAGIEVERLRAEPEEAEVEKALADIAERRATLEDVTEDRPAAAGDVVVCDFVGRAAPKDQPDAEPVPFAGGSANDMPVEVGGSGFIPGFSEAVDGIRVGETRTANVTFPEGYHAPDLAGRPAVFEITAKALKRKVVPPVGDALAEGLGVEGGAEGLREALRASLRREYDNLSRLRVKRALLDALASRADFPVPEGMVTAEFDQIWARVEADMKAGRLDEDDAGKDEATLRADYRAIAERRIRLGLLVSEIGRTNGVQVSQEELARAMRNEAARYPGREKELMEFFRKNPGAVESVRAPVFEEKVVDFMLELAKVSERTVPAEELRAAAVPTTA